jgi:hypothetical protein
VAGRPSNHPTSAKANLQAVEGIDMGCLTKDQGDVPTPDYQQAARIQAESSKDVTQQQIAANRPNIQSSTGSQQWTQDPATGQWTLNQSLNAAGERALGAQQGLTAGLSGLAARKLGDVRNELGRPMDWSGMPAAGGSVGYDPNQLQRNLDFSGAQGLGSGADTRNAAEQAIYERATSRLDPQWAQREEGLRTQLYNQGLREGDEAYDRAMETMGNQRTDAYQTAMNEAIMGGGAEASREFGMDLASRQQQVGEQQAQAEFVNQATAQGLSMDQAVSAYQNQLRQSAIAEELQRRGMSLSEINALLAGNQVGEYQAPGFIGATGAEPMQALAAENMKYQSELDKYNANAGKRTALGQILDPGSLFSF